MTRKNLKYSIQLEISSLEDSQKREVEENGKESERIKDSLDFWKRMLSFIDEPDPLPVQQAFAIVHLDYSDAMDLAGFFTRRGNKVTVERTGEGLTQDWYRIRVDGNDGELLRRQFDA